MGQYIDEYFQKHCLPQTCPICGKGFIPAPEHAWKIGHITSYAIKNRRDDAYQRNVCSYTCMRKWEREEEAKIKAKKAKIKSRKNPKYLKKDDD